MASGRRDEGEAEDEWSALQLKCSSPSQILIKYDPTILLSISDKSLQFCSKFSSCVHRTLFLWLLGQIIKCIKNIS